jgi:hypothetical protein
MSIDEMEIMNEAALSDFIEDIETRSIKDYKLQRLYSYYQENPDVITPALLALEEAESLVPDHPSAAVVFSAIAIEVGIKKALIAPFVSGMIHVETAAELIVNLIMEHRQLEKFKEMLRHILLTTSRLKNELI